MRLRISNFAKIRCADIKVNGLTVICGLNNTGKSTVGKALHAVFNSLHGIDAAISEQRRRLLCAECASVLKQAPKGSDGLAAVEIKLLALHLADAVNALCAEGEVPGYESVFQAVCKNLKTCVRHLLAEELSRALYEIVRLPVDKVVNSYVSSYFSKMFGGQVNPIYDDSVLSRLGLAVRDNEIQLTFGQNQCTGVRCPITLEHRSVFIDNPFVIDHLAPGGSRFRVYSDRPMEEELYDKLSQYSQIMQSGDVAYQKAMVAETLAKVEDMLDSVIQGKIVEASDGLAIAPKAGGKPLLLKNASLGIKSFSILYMLLESLQLRKKDVLILDEPEIHLHTQWQLLYAEIIVLLQKLFDLTVVITTHSPFFSDAIEVFSSVHGTRGNTNFYLSKSDGDYTELTEVTDNVGLIYDVITPSLSKLKELRYNLNNPSPEE